MRTPFLAAGRPWCFTHECAPAECSAMHEPWEPEVLTYTLTPPPPLPPLMAEGDLLVVHDATGAVVALGIVTEATELGHGERRVLFIPDPEDDQPTTEENHP